MLRALMLPAGGLLRLQAHPRLMAACLSDPTQAVDSCPQSRCIVISELDWASIILGKLPHPHIKPGHGDHLFWSAQVAGVQWMQMRAAIW